MGFEHVETAWIFPTQLTRLRLEEAASWNPSLRAEILAKAATVPTTPRGESSSWQSDNGFLESSGAAKALREQLGAALQRCFDPERRLGGCALEGWANVLWPGDHFSPHQHRGAAWSGVYYVDVGAGGQGGELFLLDPRAGAGQVESGLAPASPSALRLHPASGELVIFPGWLMHWVAPWRGSSPRISVAFNAW
jgi:hypothetical protein